MVRKSIKKRARTRSGQFIADDPKTILKNEAYESTSILQNYKETMSKFFKLYWKESACQEEESILNIL